MKTPANAVLGRKLARRYHRSTCTIKRKTALGWVVIAANAACYIQDSSDRPPRPDGHDAGTDNVRTWNLSFPFNSDVRMRDQIWNATTAYGDILPVLTVATEFETESKSSDWVVCHAEDSAVAQEWISFYREHENESTTTTGPYPCNVDWEDITGRDPTNYSAGSHLTFVVLTGPSDMDVAQLDYASAIDGFRGGQVIEVRKPVGERREVRVQVDTGYRG